LCFFVLACFQFSLLHIPDKLQASLQQASKKDFPAFWKFLPSHHHPPQTIENIISLYPPTGKAKQTINGQ